MNFGDLVGLEAEMAQLDRVRRVKGQVSALQAQPHDPARLESLSSQLQDQKKEAAFHMGVKADRLAQLVEHYPVQVYALASIMLDLLVKENISTASFTSFEDKEFVANVENKLKLLMHDSHQRLDLDQLKQGKNCVNIFDQLPILEQAISMTRAKEKYLHIAPNWEQFTASKRIKDQRHKRLALFITILAGSASLFCLVQGYWWGLVMAASVYLIFLLWFSSLVDPAPWEALKRFVFAGSYRPRPPSDLEDEIHTYQGLAKLSDEAQWAAITDLFGSETSQNLEAQFIHWRAYLFQRIGIDFLEKF